MILRTPRSTRTDPLSPDTTLFRSDDLLVAENIPICGHIANIARRRGLSWNQAVFHYVDQHRVGMVPGMAGFVVRRSGQFAVRHTFSPVDRKSTRLNSSH